MMTNLPFRRLLLLLALLAPLPLHAAVPVRVILKLDDLVVQPGGGVAPAWEKTAAYLRESGTKASIGIIANSLEGDHPAYFQWIRELAATGRFEFWNHGYDHRQWQEAGRSLQEFRAPPYEQQKEHMERANHLAREKLGFAFTAFGAPFNATDDATVRVLEEDGDIRVWLFGDPIRSAGKTVLPRIPATDIEQPLFHPNRDKFIRGYRQQSGERCLVLQGHPAQWDEEGFRQFTGIVEFLHGEGAQFVLPSEMIPRS